jgi:16S rRNA (adenine1518-N6/adenine1519-N6)-dimethyltransferase
VAYYGLNLLNSPTFCLELDLAAALPPNIPYPQKVVANIPYNITGPILTHLLGTIAQPNPHPFTSLVLLVQKEVAERITATPGSKTFGSLSIKVQYLAQAEIVALVPAGAFYPPPKVDSAVIRLRPSPPVTPAQNPAHLDQLLRLGFGMRRKMLSNTLEPLVSKQHLGQVLAQMGLNPQIRAEGLTLSQWVALSNALTPTLQEPIDSPNVVSYPDSIDN